MKQLIFGIVSIAFVSTNLFADHRKGIPDGDSSLGAGDTSQSDSNYDADTVGNPPMILPKKKKPTTYEKIMTKTTVKGISKDFSLKKLPAGKSETEQNVAKAFSEDRTPTANSKADTSVNPYAYTNAEALSFGIPFSVFQTPEGQNIRINGYSGPTTKLTPEQLQNFITNTAHLDGKTSIAAAFPGLQGIEAYTTPGASLNAMGVGTGNYKRDYYWATSDLIQNALRSGSNEDVGVVLVYKGKVIGGGGMGADDPGNPAQGSSKSGT